MPAFKRRTKAEKRNRARKKLIRKIKASTGCPAWSRNHQRSLAAFLKSLEGIEFSANKVAQAFDSVIEACKQLSPVFRDITRLKFASGDQQ